MFHDEREFLDLAQEHLYQEIAIQPPFILNRKYVN